MGNRKQEKNEWESFLTWFMPALTNASDASLNGSTELDLI